MVKLILECIMSDSGELCRDDCTMLKKCYPELYKNIKKEDIKKPHDLYDGYIKYDK